MSLIRPAAPQDVSTMVALVRELADFERAPDEVHLTEPQLTATLFGERPALYAHVAEDDTGEVVGFAVWFLNFSTWRGTHGIYLEDLYVRPAARRLGLGRGLLTELARICVERGYARLEWWVLDWNTDAHAFYRSIGAEPMDEWTVWRLTGSALTALGGRTDPGHAG